MNDSTSLTSLTKESLTELVAPQSAPCLSLYQPTHRRYPENQQDPIRFRNLVKELETSLLQAYPSMEAQLLLKPFEALASDNDFWNHTLDGLAVLGTPGLFRVFRLPRAVAELAVVADSFHIKPLWQFLQSVDRYQVLGLSRDKIRLFEGDRDALEEIELAAGVPRTITDALGSELTEPHQTVASYGGVGGSSNAMHHGHGGKSDEVDIDADRFFRSIDRAVLEHHSRATGLPLILAALPEHHHRFHSVSQNPFLLTEGIKVNPDAVKNDALRTLAWQVIEPQYEARLAKLINDFEQATATGRGSDKLPEITAAAASGRVATLFIAADCQIAAHLDEGTGKVVGDALNNPRVDDVLDDLGELVSRMGGDVLVIPAARMPTRTGVAAIYRY
ncbi:MAG: hypothetical protein H0W44_02375 [Gammaproteobacteria bacterium]|nr:hypothetical protein [Gammaproteobacteria bacterium]